MNLDRTTKLIATAAAAAAVMAPLGQAGTTDKAHLAGSFVAPGQVSEAQLNAGHDPSTRMVQIGGALVRPSQVSAWQSTGGSGSSWASNDGSSTDFGTVAIAAAAALGGLALIGSSTIVLHRRRGLATA